MWRDENGVAHTNVVPVDELVFAIVFRARLADLSGSRLKELDGMLWQSLFAILEEPVVEPADFAAESEFVDLDLPDDVLHQLDPDELVTVEGLIDVVGRIDERWRIEVITVLSTIVNDEQSGRWPFASVRARLSALRFRFRYRGELSK